VTTIAILFAMWYINTYVLKGEDMRLIFVKSVSFIICSISIGVLILKVVSPKEVNSENLKFLFGMIKDMGLIMVGTLFNKIEKK